MQDSALTPPPIPVHLADFPTIGGLVIPFVVLRHRNGDAALGLVDHDRLARCLRERRCGVCGHNLRYLKRVHVHAYKAKRSGDTTTRYPTPPNIHILAVA